MAPLYPLIFDAEFLHTAPEKDKKVPVYVTQLKGALIVVQQEYPNMLSTGKVQKHLRSSLHHEYRPGDGVWVTSVQSQGKDEIMSLKQQIMQLQVAIQRPPQQTTSGNCTPVGNGGSGNRNKSNTMGNGSGQNDERSDCSRRKYFHCEGWGHVAQDCLSSPLNEYQGEIADTYNLLQGHATKWKGAREAIKSRYTGRTWVP